MKESIHDLLLRSFDSDLSAKEQKQLDEALTQSEVLRLEKEQMTILRQTIGQGGTAKFKPFFAERVMHRIQAEEAPSLSEDFFSSLNSLFRPVAFATILLIVAMVSFNAVKKDVIISSALDSPDVSLEEVFNPMVDWIKE